MTPDPSDSQISDIRHSRRAQVTETQPGSHPLRLTVVRARNPPRFKTLLWRKGIFYVTVTYEETTRQTRSVQRRENIVEWNENLDTFIVPRHSHITVSLYEKRTKPNDILIGSQRITCEPPRELDIVFGNSRQTKEPATVLTITVSSNASSSRTATVNTPNLTLDNPVTEGGVTRPIVPSDTEAAQLTGTAVTAPISDISRTGDLLVDSGTPVGAVPDSQTGMSRHPDRAEGALDAVTLWKSAVNIMKQVMDTVSPILKERASLAWTQLSNIPETFVHQLQRDDNFRSLLEAILNVFEFGNGDVLRNIQPASTQAKILNEMLQCVSECANFIKSYAFTETFTKQVGKRALENVEHLRETVVRLRELRRKFSTDIAVPKIRNDARSQVTDMSNLASETEMTAIIGESLLLGGWRFTDREGCHQGTRKDFLDHIFKWVENSESERGLVLFGQAGTGKSSIAHEVALHFDKTYLGSYVAFSRAEQPKDEAYHFFTTLAGDLSGRYPPFKLGLRRAIAGNPSLRTTRDYRRLFDWLLLEPLKNVPPGNPILVVVDGLDESGVKNGQNPLHTFLARRLIDLPPNFRILITSRSEDVIEHAFANAPSVRTLYMDDRQLASNTEQDIGLYIQSKLREDVFKDHGSKLVRASEGLFQWAAVACGFINSPASLGLSYNECVQRLLGSSRGHSGEGPLDNLYEEVLQGYFNSDEAQALFRSIMGQLFAAIEPLSINSLLALRQHAPIVHPEDSNLVLRILRYLGSLLSNVNSRDQTGPILPLHTSFRDFLTSKTSNVFYVDLADAHHQLTHSCLGLMLDELKFNICKLESSYLANSDVPDLESRIASCIPSALPYACIYWGDHLFGLSFDHDVLKKLQLLFETKFLFWLEVLSVKKSVGVASRALSSLLVWLRREHSQTEVKNLLGLASDASSFVRYFGKAVARSSPHIYVSALPFAPASSQILHQYLPQFPRTLRLERGQLSHWPALEMTIKVHDTGVLCVAFSLDGEHIASASSDHTIRVWDATTGQIVAGPFTGPTDWAISVAFSPDGERIASASHDRTIRVWDPTTGQIVAGPFTGHTDTVTSVIFSPGGERIASTSHDRTIRVWNVTTGQIVVDPFTGHTDSVTSVAFSPGGERIASASCDHTIRVWDAATGQIIAGPFTGHTDSVTSVAFSPDGERIASASDDHTIRVWDATTGQIVAGPFTGHTNWVTSVVFSPDGECIASASFDRTIRVWDATTGQIVAGPFAGHTNPVISVAFSPDGERIASASHDHTIRVWDPTTGQIVMGPFTGHTDSVTSVAFSPDGECIASASFDRTIRVWDAITGQIVAGPFTGHTNAVTSVAFSPDRECIASASDDHTIRVWDAATGQIVVGPFTGHTDSVTSVAFSPGGERIASASCDHTIRVWDATTGQIVAGPFTGHTDWVTSVAFSPDGECIASASFDHTIRVWDATTGQIVAGPFTGHTDSVASVAFSPDGERITSASHDRTIRVWNATTGQIIAGSLTGHTNLVTSVAFSPDGECIASASFDRTIRVWDATAGQIIAGPFTGHTTSVTSVAFSPDGERIASASYDDTIRVWDATTGYTASASDNGTIHVKTATRAENIKNQFTDQSLIDSDGWLHGEKNELVLWIPELHRSCLHRPSTIWIAGKHETRLDLSDFAYGSNWATSTLSQSI